MRATDGLVPGEKAPDEGAAGVLAHVDLVTALGGTARATVVVLLASILGLQAADTGAIGALAAPLESAFHIGNTQLGLLVTVTTLVGVVVTLPFGTLADHHSRTRLLQIVVFGWAVASLASAFSTSFTMLLVTRLALGGVVAASGPAVASLVGDLFPAGERSRLYSFVLMGELIGAGVGILLAGALSAVAGWRVALGALAIPALVLSWALWKYLPEPARGGQAYLHTGDTEITTEEDVEATLDSADAGEEDEAEEPSVVQQQAEESGARPQPGTVLRDPSHMDLWETIRYVLRVRTNVALIVASGLGYFFFGGVETFAELFLRARFGVGQTEAAVLFIVIAAGGVIGVLVSGRTADSMIRRGHTTARLAVASVAFLTCFVLFIPGVAIPSLIVTIPLLVLASAGLGAINAPMDTARLDVLPSLMWGRAEAVRTVLRQLLQGLAPLLFGLVSSAFGAARAGLGSGVNAGASAGSVATAHGLEMAFLVLSVPLLGAAVVLWSSRRVYLSDMVAAARSDRHHRASETT